MRKKSQGGLNAAILVAIIAGLIILYIVFLPASQREKLLDNTTRAPSGQESPNVLLREFPGSLSASEGLENDKIVPDAFLVETTNANEIASFNPFIIRNGWFDKRAQTVNFDMDEPENTDNVVLSFTVKNRKGVLTIKLNNEVIFESEIVSGTIEPVKLDKRLLQKSNTLEFSVSSVGARFWTTNEYSFENVKIIGDITDTSRQESTNIFTLSDSEYASLDKANLRFIPYCGNVNSLGTLEIYVNNKKLFASVPACENTYKQSIPKSVLNEGENNIVFKTSKGSYSVEQIRISLDFRQPSLRTYYFKIDSNILKQIRDNDKDAELTLKFIDDRTQKRLKIDVNGNVETVDTTKSSFSKNIDSKVSEGNNYVRLEPIDNVEVVEIAVELV